MKRPADEKPPVHDSLRSGEEGEPALAKNTDAEPSQDNALQDQALPSLQENIAPWHRALAFVRRVIVAYDRDDVPLLSAAIAFYALLSLAPILVLALALAETFAAGEAVRADIAAWASRHVSAEVADLVNEWARNYHTTEGSGVAIAISAVVLVVSATRLFAHVRTALDRIWHIESAPARSFGSELITRLLGLSIVALLGVLLLVAIGVKIALRAAERYMGLGELPFFWTLIDWGIYFGLVGGVIYVMYRRLPNALVRRRHALIGAFTTAGLLILGGEVIALYVSRANITSSFGAAGSTMALVLWIYYASQVFLVGAIVTWLFAEKQAKLRKRRIRLKKRAAKVRAAREANRVDDEELSGRPS